MPSFGGNSWRQAWQILRGLVEDLEEKLQEEWATSIQAIERIEEFNCGGEWWVYVKTALPAVGSAMWLLLTPSAEEILENYLNPKTGRGGSRRGRRARRRWRGGNRGQRRLFFGNGIPDIDEEIGKRLPGGRAIRGRRIGPGEWLFWTGVDTMDRALWYFLLWEASQTFLTKWHSELLKSEQCSDLPETWLNYQSYRETDNIEGPFFDSDDTSNADYRFGWSKPDAGSTDTKLDRGVNAFVVCRNTMTVTGVNPEGYASGTIRRRVTAISADDTVRLLAQDLFDFQQQGEETIELPQIDAAQDVPNCRAVETRVNFLDGSVTGQTWNIVLQTNLSITGSQAPHE